MKNFINQLDEVWKNKVFQIGEFRGQYYIIIDNKEILRDLIKYLKEQGFNHLQTLTAVDYLNHKERARFEVIYQLCNLDKRWAIRLRVEVPEEDPTIDSIVDLFPSANFLEREVFDLFGISFKGHPHLKRILLPETWTGYPLRKDYPLDPEEKPEDFIKLKDLKERLEKYGIK